MDIHVPKDAHRFEGAAEPAETRWLVEKLLAMSNEEVELLERLYEATAGVRSSTASPEQKGEAIERVLSDDPELREAFRRVAGVTPAGSGQRIALG